MQIGFYTLGCKVNQYETQAMAECFKRVGHEVVSGAVPDVFIINSCTVTAESDRKTRQIVRKYRAKYPHAVLVLAGCMPQAFPELADETDADVVIGNTGGVLEAVDEYLKTGQKTIRIAPHKPDEKINPQTITDFSEKTRAFIKIEDGCNRFCSYCIIPTARGRVRSKPLEELLKEASDLAEAGYREIVLVGINLSAYRHEEATLADAVRTAAQPDGICRVRLGSLEPDQISDELLKELKRESKFCPHFHISMQSGCDETLKRMNRHYDTCFYEDLCRRIRMFFPDAAITTDIMVGFPGETEEEFSKTCDFVKRIGFSKAHVFAYSRRKGTKAYDMPAQVTRNEKARRSKLMIQICENSRQEYEQKMRQRPLEVLAEERVLENGRYIYKGFSREYVSVSFVYGDDCRGRCVLCTPDMIV